jgi:hypothetical protein
MQERRIPKEDPQKLRMRAVELKLKAERLFREADNLLEKAEQIEAARDAKLIANRCLRLRVIVGSFVGLHDGCSPRRKVCE